MILTLPVTILIEGMVILVYGAVRKKPVGTLLFASAIINMLTQVLLWVTLGIFFREYLAALLAAEGVIWLVESLCMLHMTKGGLDLKSAFALSFCMNAASFGAGWFLPM